ncbi:MAG: transglycosylase SLT domain-containing protein [Myxococcota bacterium]|nr:transglycosylase SLT domain-containing protein [Myxococcota bacterium]
MNHCTVSRALAAIQFIFILGGAGGCALSSGQAPLLGPQEPLTAPRSLSAAEKASHAAPLEPYFSTGEAAQAESALRDNRLLDAYRLFGELAASASDAVLTPRARFMAAYLAQLVGQSEAALQDLPDLAKELPMLADTAYERAACAARDLGRPERALELSRLVSHRSAYKADMQLLEADSLRALDRCKEAVPIYRELATTMPEGRGIEARLRLVQCQAALFRQGALTFEEAQDALRSSALVVAQAPSSVFATAAVEARIELLAALGQTEPPEPKERKAALLAYDKAKQLFDEMRNPEAEKALAKVVRLSRGEGSSLYCRASYDLATAVQRQRDHARAAILFEEMAQQCNDPELRVRALYKSAKGYQTVGRLKDAIRLYGLVEQEYPEHSYADDARLGAARSTLALGDRAAFGELLATLPSAYPSGDMRAEALWELSYEGLSRGDSLAARESLAEYYRLFPRETGWYSAGRAPYWLARVEELLGRTDLAMELYEKCLVAAPLSYYALLAYNRLVSADPQRASAWMAQLAPVGDHVEPHIDQKLLAELPSLATAVELLRLGLVTRMRRELDALLATTAHLSPQVPLAAALLARQAGYYNDVKRFAVTAAGSRLHYPSGQDEDAWKLSYPKAFEDEVEQASLDSGTERALVWAVMREESSFDPLTESWANAIGLMQLLLPTAKGIGQRLGLKVNRKTLVRPEVNIAIGAAYLSALSERLGHLALVIAGYNAGEGAVGRWLGQWAGQDLDLFVESIPYDQTRGYTKRVLSSYAAYSFLYGAPRGQIPKIPLALPR